jgi:hypothetical protein
LVINLNFLAAGGISVSDFSEIFQMKKILINKLVIFLGFTLLLFILFIFFYQHFFSPLNKKAGLFNISTNSSSSENSINFEEIAKNYQKKEFITQDGKLKIENLSEWFLTKDEQLLKKASLKNFPENYNLNLLFFAQKIKNNRIANLTLSEGTFNDKKTTQEVFEILKETVGKNGLEMEVIKSETKDNETSFEARYKEANKENFLSKEKIILFDQEKGKFYIITFYTLEKDWEIFKNEAEAILNSAHLVD